jgi:hypothetical protein
VDDIYRQNRHHLDMLRHSGGKLGGSDYVFAAWTENRDVTYEFYSIRASSYVAVAAAAAVAAVSAVSAVA